MVIIKHIFSRYALVGSDLELKENVVIDINADGRISEIKSNSSPKTIGKRNRYLHHLAIPKFINSHTHLGDAALKDQAYGLSLDEAVGMNGLKYKAMKLSKKDRLSSMRSALIEMIQYGISTCYDFREGGLQGINELKEASLNLPINLHIFGRPLDNNTVTEIISHCDGLGLPTPVIFSRESIIKLGSEAAAANVMIATHIAETPEVVEISLNKFGTSDLQIALKYLNPKILIHLNELKEDELQEIAVSKLIVFCPRSNAYFGLKFPKITQFLDYDYLIGLGTDNVMTISPNILAELRWLILKLKEQKYCINPIKALKMIISNPSEALELETGCLKQGYWADFLVVDLNTSRTKYGTNPIMTLLFRSQLPSDISLNLFHGKEVLYDFK